MTDRQLTPALKREEKKIEREREGKTDRATVVVVRQ